MMNIKSFVYSLFFILISVFSGYILLIKALSEKDKLVDTFIISSGSQGGNYNKVGRYLEAILNQISSDKFVFKSIPSNGSIDNIKRLKDRYADFAIVQRDVLISNYYGEGDKIKNISVVSPLFQEKLIIYTHKSSHIPFIEFRATLDQLSGTTRIGITSKDGAAYKTFENISNLLSVPLNKIEFVEGNYNELVRKYKNNDIDYLLTLSLPIQEIEHPTTKYVYFSDNDVRLLISRMRSFSKATISEKKGRYTIGVWSLLVGLNSSIDKIGDDRIINRLLQSSDNLFPKLIKSNLEHFRLSPSLYDEYLRTLPVAPEFLKYIGRDIHYKYIYFVLAFSVLVVLVYFYKGFLNKKKKHWKYLWIRYNHILIGSIVVAISYLLCIEYLIHSEETLFSATAIKSRILDLPRADLHVWNAIRMFAQIDDGIFPLSVYGKLVTALSTYITLFGAIAIAVSEYGMYKLTAKRRGGKMKIKDENHVIIAGWNNHTSYLIKELLSAAKGYHNKTIKVICVVSEPASILKNYPDISDFEHLRDLAFVEGDIRNKDVALQSNTFFASAIILSAEDNTINADEKTLMRALSINKFNRKQRQELGIEKYKQDTYESYKTRDDINSTYIIAEVNNNEFVEDLRNAGVNGIVNRGEITKNILIQSLLNPGVSILLNNVLSFSNETNEFYTIDLRDENNKQLRGKTFDELILPLRQQQILLIAIKVVYLDEVGRIIVDTDELEKLLKQDKLTRQIITNPINETESSRKTDSDDHLIVLAANSHRLNEGIKKISFRQ